MKRLALICALLLWGQSAFTQPLNMAERTLFVAFADAVSEGDPDMVALARDMVQHPPSTLETIGFYGMEDAPPASRALRGIISALDNDGHLISFEPYLMLLEFEGVMRDAGAFSSDRPLPDILTLLPEGEWDTDAAKARGARAMNDAISLFADAAVDEMALQDRVILDVTLPAGDVVFYWVTTPDIAADWRCVLLLAEDAMYGPPRVERTLVRPMDWAAYREQVFWSVNIDPAHYPTDQELPAQTCLLS